MLPGGSLVGHAGTATCSIGILAHWEALACKDPAGPLVAAKLTIGLESIQPLVPVQTAAPCRGSYPYLHATMMPWMVVLPCFHC